MKRLKDFAWFLGFCILVLPAFAKLGAQQGHPPAMRTFASQNDEKLDPTIPWISEYQQPFIYQVWWAEIAQCEGLPLDPERARRVQFFQVNAPDFIPENVPAIVYAVTYGEAYDGQTYVAYPYLWNKQLISHEMIHLLRKLAGDPNWMDHDPRYYGRCRMMSSGTPEPNQ